MSTYWPLWKRLFVVLGVSLACVLLAGPVAAQSVPQGYQSDAPLQKGMIIRLKPGDGNKIQAVTQQDQGEVFGVVVSSADVPVSLSNTLAAQEVFVANSGQYEVLVSDQNGQVKSGDNIAVSSLGGIGMKAGKKQEFILGKALNDFDGRTNVESSTMLESSTGNQKVNIGRVSIEVDVGRNPNYSEQEEAGVPRFLAVLAEAVTDRPVTAFRIYASLAVLALCVITAGVVIFSGVRTGMIAVGRNPLAKKTISRNLVQVILMALIVFVIGLIGVYLLLRI